MAAPTYDFCLVLHDDVTIFTFQNNSVYGSPAANRGDTGDILLAYHVTEDALEEFLTVDSTPYNSKISYDITNALDGHYKFELLEFLNFSNTSHYIPEIRDSNNIITTYASVIYYPTTQKFYKAILDNPASPNSIAPDAINGATYWQEITDFTNSEVRSNTNISVGILDTIGDARSRKCVKDALYKIVVKDPACFDTKTLLPYLKKAVLLMGAEAKNDDSKPEQSETIIRTLQNICPVC